MEQSYPRKSVVWRGAILGGIVNATMTAARPGFAHERQWVSFRYHLNGGDGREGVIVFAGGHWYEGAPLVGVFHDVHSDHYWHENRKPLDWYFENCPAFHRKFAEQAVLPWLELELDGQLEHRVTTAFWDVDDRITSVEPWDRAIENGVSLIQEELVENCDAAIAGFQEDYAMSAAQASFARSLFDRKIARPAALIQLSVSEVEFLKSTFVDPKVTYAELEYLSTRPDLPEHIRRKPTAGPKWWESIDTAAEAEKAITICRQLFQEIGILFPGEG